MNLSKKEIQSFIHAARRDHADSFDMIEKHVFTSMIAGMRVKLLDRLLKGKNAEMEKQLAALNRMENFLERLSFKNCVFYFQAKTILAQDRRITILEQEKIDLIKKKEELEKENVYLKRNIK